MKINFKLDTTSDYMMDVKKYPDAICDVMVNVDDDTYNHVKKYFTLEKGEKPEYIDTYVFIDPETELVKKFLFIGTYDNDKAHLEISITNFKDMVTFYHQIADEGGIEFYNFIEKAVLEIKEYHADKLTNFIKKNNDFLMENFHLSSEYINYSNLISNIRIPKEKLIDKINGLFLYAQLNPETIDELSFYEHIACYMTKKEVRELAFNKEMAMHAIQFMKEHGLY